MTRLCIPEVKSHLQYPSKLVSYLGCIPFNIFKYQKQYQLGAIKFIKEHYAYKIYAYKMLTLWNTKFLEER